MTGATSQGTSLARNMRRWIWLPIALAAAAYYAAPKILRRTFSPPQRDATDTPAVLGLPEEQVWLRSVNGTRLHGWFIPVDEVAPAVIVLHGWGGNAALMLPLAPHLHRAGFHALFLDARNHGISEHDSFTSLPRFAEDLDVAASWLRSHPVVTSIGVVGHSVGAGAAILSASRSDQFDAVVSVSSLAHPGEMMQRQMSKLPKPLLASILGAVQRVIGYRFHEFAPRNRVSHVTAPLLLVHGGSDQVVPIESLHELIAASRNAEVLVVPDGGHSDLRQFEPHVGVITGFLSRQLSASTAGQE
ncbi:MAG: alpha/beta fold hydrolase [Acidimicrobiia bacterium]|nr:alpha/beta fold hydrolase [Acidimicrobiia bacterium]